MSAPAEKFNPEAYKQASEGYIKYLKTTWGMAVEIAESCIANPHVDDLEAIDQRRGLVYNLAVVIFDKMTLDARDSLWRSREGDKPTI